MIQDQSTIIGQHLQQIADILLINGTMLENSGLWYGKMGVAVFFFHYAQYAGNELFEDYAVEIIRAIQADIHRDSITDYDRGLAGIGAGIGYLSQSGFLAIDTDEVLEDFDNRIRQDIMYQPQENNSLGNGLCGLCQYFLYRVKSLPAGADELRSLTNHKAIIHVVNILENEENPQADDLPDILSFLSRVYPLDICNPKIDTYLDHVVKDLAFHNLASELLTAWTLPLLRLATIRHQMKELAYQCVEQALQSIDSTGIPDITDRLLWLLQCKRLMAQNGFSVDLMNQLEDQINHILNQFGDGLRFEKGKLSLKGTAGTGLAMLTATGQCDDAWLDLLG